MGIRSVQATEVQPQEVVQEIEAEKDSVCNYLLTSNRLKPADLKRAETYREQNGGDLVTLLVRLGLESERDASRNGSL